jgi:hypothetical protein
MKRNLNWTEIKDLSANDQHEEVRRSKPTITTTVFADFI